MLAFTLRTALCSGINNQRMHIRVHLPPLLYKQIIYEVQLAAIVTGIKVVVSLLLLLFLRKDHCNDLSLKKRNSSSLYGG